MADVFVFNPRLKSSFPPLGMAYTLRCLDDSNISFDFLDCNQSLEDIYGFIAKGNYKVIATGGMLGSYTWFHNILPEIRKRFPDIKIVLGGAIAKDVSPDVLFPDLKVDYLLRGEAETNFVALLELLLDGKGNFESIPGLTYREENGIFKENRIQRLDLQERNIMPAWAHFHMKSYLKEGLRFYLRTFMPVLTGRGCINKCAFCSPTLGAFKPRPISHVMEEMQWLVKNYDFDAFYFASEETFVDEESVNTFCDEYLKHFNKQWFALLRTDVNLSVSAYRKMKEAGCIFLCFGIESFSDNVLKALKKNTTSEKHLRALENASSAGIYVRGAYMMGNIDETAEDIRYTMEIITKMAEKHGGMFMFYTNMMYSYPGTHAYTLAQKRGLVTDTLKFLLNSRPFSNSDINMREIPWMNLTKMQDEELWEVIDTEARKFRRYCMEHLVAKDLKKFLDPRETRPVRIIGKCSKCGGVLDFSLVRPPGSILDIWQICKNCCEWNFANLFNCEELKEHWQNVKLLLDKAKGVLFLGDMISDFFLYERFNFDFSKLLAWTSGGNDEKNAKRKYYYSRPYVHRADLPGLDYDTVVSLMPQEKITKEFLRESNLQDNVTVISIMPSFLNPDALKFLDTTDRIFFIGQDSTVKDLFNRPEMGKYGKFCKEVKDPEELTGERPSETSILILTHAQLKEKGIKERIAASGIADNRIMYPQMFISDGIYS